jgi:hypothetical protein
MNYRHIVCMAALPLILGACGNSGPDSQTADTAADVTAKQTVSVGFETANRTEYDRIDGLSGLSLPTRLCHLLEYYDAGAGLYRVRSLTGYTEDMIEHPGHTAGFTYAQLDLVEDWSGKSPRAPIIRFRGGPADVDVVASWQISLRVGETIGALLEPPTAENRGYFNLRQLAIFHQREDGRYTNDQLFASAGADARELKRTIGRAISAGPNCEQFDVKPDTRLVVPHADPSGEETPPEPEVETEAPSSAVTE